MMTKKEKKIERSREEKIKEGKDLKAKRGMRRPVEVHCVRPEKFQFLEKWQNRNFDYEIIISIKNP